MEKPAYLSSEQILIYINEEETKHRATLENLKKTGKTYRSRDVTHEIACINILRDIKEVITRPQKNIELIQALNRFKG